MPSKYIRFLYKKTILFCHDVKKDEILMKWRVQLCLHQCTELSILHSNTIYYL